MGSVYIKYDISSSTQTDGNAPPINQTQTFHGVDFLNTFPGDAAWTEWLGWNPGGTWWNPVFWLGYATSPDSAIYYVLTSTMVDYESFTNPQPADGPMVNFNNFDYSGTPYNFGHKQFVWRAVDTPEIFDNKANTVNFTQLSSDQEFLVDGAYQLYDAGGGDDNVTLPNSKVITTRREWDSGSVFTGGLGSDTINGGALADNIYGDGLSATKRDGNDILSGAAGDDYLAGGGGNNTVDGGADHDVLEVVGARKAYSLSIQSFATGGGATGSVTSKAGSATLGNTTFQNIEAIQFTDQLVPLHQWTFQIDRAQDGNISKMAFLEDGVEVSSVSGFYDDATPIKAGTYSAVLRMNGHIAAFPPCIELVKFDQNAAGGYVGTSTVAGRTAVQIHGGTSIYSSEGCFVQNGFLPPFLDHIKSDLSGMDTVFGKTTETGTSIEFYDLPMPIKVVVNNAIPQPKIYMTSPTSGSVITATDSVQDDKAGTYRLKLDLVDDGVTSGISREVALYFTASGSAKYKDDFAFANDVTYFSKGAHKGQFMVMFEDGKSMDTLGIKIFANDKNEKDENIHLNIVDMDIYNKPHGQWQLTEDSTHTGWTATEKLLKGNSSFDLNILADKSIAGEPFGFYGASDRFDL